MEATDSTKSVRFNLDGKDVFAFEGETIWDVAKRLKTDIPHLCHANSVGYKADGNCRACMVEIDGERVLAASCIRKPTEGMTIKTNSARAQKSRKMVVELLLTDQPEDAHDNGSHFWSMVQANQVEGSRFPKIESERVPTLDSSHLAMHVNLDACIHCNLCVKACREVQVNDVIGMSGRGHDSKIVFDFDDPMGASTCVACGECVQACPTGALMPASALDANEIGDSGIYDRAVSSVCPYCGVGCQLSFKIKDEKIAWVDGIEGPANEKRLCVKGRFGFDYIEHKHRLVKPLIRREDAPQKDLNVDPENPLTHFREAEWDEALELVASKLTTLKEQSGGNAIAGFGSAKCSNEEAYIFQKLIRQAFGHNNVDHCTRLCHASSVAALLENIGSGAVTATFNEIKNAEVAIVIGANPVENHPVAATYFKQFSKNGGTLIVMDPRGQGLKRHAKHMLQFRPGTDVAMLNAIMHIIVKERLYNQEYIDTFTEGWNSFKTHLEDFAPEKMSPICGISVDVLQQVARAFSQCKAGMIFWGMGVSQHIHGTDNARCLISLALMCGHVGKSGTGLHPLRGQNNVQGASDAGLIPMFLPDYQSVTSLSLRKNFSELWNDSYINPEPGLTVTEIIDDIHAGNTKGMYILGENPAMSDPDVSHARDALAKLDHLVVQDIFLTETANYADVILPASAWPEKNGTVTNTNRQVQMGRAALKPPGDAKEDWWIVTEIAKHLGLDWQYTHPKDIFEEMKCAMKSFDNITWERLENENVVTYPSLHENDPGQPIVFADGFPREKGRAKFTPASIVAPAEVPDGQYPMILITGRQLEHWHTGSMTRRANVLDWAEPEANASLHPKTLRKLGRKSGEMIQIKTRRGAITIMARSDRAIAEDMVFVPFAYVEAPANMLTNSKVDPDGKIPGFKFSACKVTTPMDENVVNKVETAVA